MERDTEQLARFISEVSYDDLPPGVILKVKNIIFRTVKLYLSFSRRWESIFTCKKGRRLITGAPLYLELKADCLHLNKFYF